METLYIVIPAYNEEENIKKVIEDWYPIIEKHNGNGQSRLIVVDDGSKDGTLSILNELAESRNMLIPVTKENGGHGAAILWGYSFALAKGADFIFQTDSDGQTLPSEFEAFWDERNQYDMIIGWRKGREDGFLRAVTTKVLKLVIRLCFGVSVADANTPFRLMKGETLGKVINLIPENFNLSNVIISVIFAKKNFRVKYIPITFRPRQGGINSINMRKIFRIGKQALSDFTQINKTLM